ncbi:nucleotide exchange factor GrpE [Gardnerella pickettii]|uniref:nucleotide exchange factor GrpE n=1 Tax=Gardnerella pickettii TaxID=2914924 RepID=UPI000C7D5751|nr:nucleotide exchange factor GrpE [Gardnerella pickettii]PKZ39446.1 nucleotide exchange factor GrpE [Gardnerella pickettii]
MSEFNANDYLSGLEDVPSAAGDSRAASASAADNAAYSAADGAAAQGAAHEEAHEEAHEAKHEAKHAAANADAAANTDAAASADADAEKSQATEDESNARKSKENNNSADTQSSEEDSLTPLGKAKKEAAEYLEALQRERAEFINFRNRAAKEQDRFRQHGITDVLTALLPALDDIDRIREHGAMDDSFKAVAAKLDKAFEKFGVEKFGEKGEDFDPTKHDAILHKPDANATKETVDVVVESGYRIGDRVIRAARVVVASPSNA